MSAIPSYSKIFTVGQKPVYDLFKTPVNVEEKVDGSQFSFGLIDGSLMARSKGADLYFDNPEKMFSKALEQVKSRESFLRPNLIYRGEYLQKPKHNTLAYERTPASNIIIFDIHTLSGDFLPPREREDEAARIDFECVPVLAENVLITSADDLRKYLDTTSVLGGQKIEGVVVKPANYGVYGDDKKVLMAKFVSEAFKEVHQGEWRKANPTKHDIEQTLINAYRTPARWSKAVIHLREKGLLTDSPKDIGLLMKEVGSDVLTEEAQEIQNALFKYFWPKIQRGITSGLPEWYKEQLLEAQFSDSSALEVEAGL